MNYTVTHQDGTVLQKPGASNPLRIPAPGKALLAFYFAASLFAILYVPYFFPVPPSTAESYIFGYNNRVGIVLLLLCASIGALWTRGLNFNFSPTNPSPKVPLRFLFIGLAVECTACAGMYLRAGRYLPVGESGYEINRIWLLSLGKTPYLDFEWTYGCALLYVPKWISGLLHLAIPQAYAVFWGMTSLLGIVLIFATINLIDFPSRHRTFIFILFSICTLLSVPNFCVSYTFQRYFLPLFFALLIYNVSRRNAQIGAKIKAGICAVVFTTVLIVISPEMAIAHAFACAVLLFPGRLVVQISRISLYLATLGALGLIFLGSVKIHLMDGVRGGGSGASFIPITLGPATLTFFGAVFICACYVVQRAGQEGIRDNTIALIAVSIPLTAAALGRCDVGHILTSGVGFFIAVFFYASASPRMWKLYCTLFIACVLLPTIFFTVLRSRAILSASALPPFPASSSPRLLYPGVAPTGDGVLEIPFGYDPIAKGFYFSDQVDYGYAYTGTHLCTPEDLVRRRNQLAQHPQRSLLLSKGILGWSEIDARMARWYVIAVSLSPYTARAAHAESVRKPICDYIRAHYSLAVPADPGNFEYELWTPKPAPLP